MIRRVASAGRETENDTPPCAQVASHVRAWDLKSRTVTAGMRVATFIDFLPSAIIDGTDRLQWVEVPVASSLVFRMGVPFLRLSGGENGSRILLKPSLPTENQVASSLNDLAREASSRSTELR
jgi:hypothetical protein